MQGFSEGRSMEQEDTKTTRKKHIVRRVVVALGVLVVVPAVLVSLLPAIISTETARKMVLHKVNASIPGKLAIASWSFGWQSGASIVGLSYSDGSNVAVQVKEVATSEGLLGLLGKTKTLGEVTVDSPTITVVVPPPPAPETADAAPPSAPAAPAPSARAPAAARPSPEPVKLGFDFTGVLKIKGGKIGVQMPLLGETSDWQDIEAAVKIESLDKPIVFDLSVAQTGGQGRLTVNGWVKAFEGGVCDPAKLRAEAKCGIDALSLAPLGAIGAACAGTPKVGGVLTSRIAARVSGADAFAAEGFVHVTNLVASGGALSSDKPYLESVKLDFDVGAEGRDLKIKTVKFDSPVMVLSAAGALADKKAAYPAGFINAEGKIDLARLARELPATLRLAKGVAVSRGTLSMKANVDSAGDALACLAEAEVADVEATSDGQKRTLDSPIALSAQVKLDKEGPHVDRFRVSSAFANANGGGDPKDMRVALKVDLAAAMREAAKFVDLGGLTAAGAFDATARVYTVSDRVRQVEAALAVNKLRIGGKTPNPVVLEWLKAGAGLQLKSDAQGALAEMADVRLTLASAPVSAEATIGSVKPGKTAADTEAEAAVVTARADVGELIDLARRMGVVAAGMEGRGDVNVTLNAALKKGVLDVEPVSVKAANLDIALEPGKRIVESNATVVAKLAADLSSCSLKVSGAKVTWSSGVLDIPQFKVDHWDRTPPALEGAGSAKIEVERLLAQLPGLVVLQPGAAIAGGLDARFGIGAAGATRGVSLEVASRELAFKMPTGAVLAEPGLKLALKADQDVKSGDLALKDLQLVSSAVGCAATGSLVNAATTRDLGLAGTLECDFKRIGELVALFTGTQLDMTGKKPQPFTIGASLGATNANDMLRGLKADVGVYMAQCKAFGVQVTNTAFALAADKGLIRADIGSRVNDGDLKLAAEIDATGKTMVLTVPPDSKVLSEVKLTEDMMAELVAKVHPILRGCGVKSGRVDVLLKKCVVPLDASWTNAISLQGELALKETVVGVGGAIGTILSLTRQDVDQVAIPDQVVMFACADGKIETSPLVVASGDFKMTVTGYAWLDGRLQYLAQAPMTEKLVGAKRYPYVKDVVIKIPIEGTAAKPKVSAQAVESALAEAAKEAAGNVLVEEGTKALEGWLQKANKKK
jgi:hypothetical protein